MYTGSSVEQDSRFSDKEKKLLKQIKFNESFNAKVDINKVKLDTIKPWIGKRITELLGMEDDVVEEFVNNQLEANTWPDPRKMQINLTGFLNGINARVFMTELWELLLSAQGSSSGIPPKFIEQKKEELKKEMEDQARLGDIIKKFQKIKENKEKEQKKDIERKKSRSRSHTRDGRSRYRDCYQEKEINKLKDPNSKKIQEKHTQRDASLAKDKVIKTNTKLKSKEQSLIRDFTKHEKKKQHSSSSSSYSSSSSSSSSSLSPDRKHISEVQKKENSIKNKRQYQTNKDESSSSESDKDKSTGRRDYHDHLSYRSRRLSRYAFNHRRYRDKNCDRYYNDRERKSARERERNRRDRERERRDQARMIRKKDRERDRRRQSEREGKSSPRRRKSRSPERKSKSDSRRARSCSKSKRRQNGKSCGRERTVKDSIIVSPLKKDDSSKLKVSLKSLSRTPSPFKKAGDKARYKPVKDILSVIHQQHILKSSQSKISNRQSPLRKKQNSNDKKNSSSSKPISITYLVIKKERRRKNRKNKNTCK